MNNPVAMACFTDVLCVWAYAAQIRLDELHEQWGEKVKVEHHFIEVFGDTASRIGEGWKKKGGFIGFGKHVVEVGEQFPHVEINPAVWETCRPASSGNAHLILKAVQVLQQDGVVDEGTCAALAWRIRLAFFRDAQDIGDASVLSGLAREQGLDEAAIEVVLRSGRAVAGLCRDAELRDQHQLSGSPSYVLNDGRQKLYGNVGYRILDANVRELMEQPDDQASWC